MTVTCLARQSCIGPHQLPPIRAADPTGITDYRLRQILNKGRPMTHAEHVAISEVDTEDERAASA